MEKVLQFLQDAGTWYLATVDAEGNPQVRPVGAQNIFEDKLYIQTGIKKEVAKQMLAHPQIAITGMAKGKWIRLNAEAVLDERIEAQQAMLDANPDLKSMYTAGDGNTAVFYIKNATAVFCSFTEDPETVQF